MSTKRCADGNDVSVAAANERRLAGCSRPGASRRNFKIHWFKSVKVSLVPFRAGRGAALDLPAVLPRPGS